MSALAAKRFSWHRLSSAKWSDSWLERLSFLGPTRAMVIEFPNAAPSAWKPTGSPNARPGAHENVRGQSSEAKWLTQIDPPMRPPIACGAGW